MDTTDPAVPNDSGVPPLQEVLLPIAAAVVRERDTLYRVGLLSFIAVVVSVLWGPRSYTAAASFIPQASQTATSLSGLAAQFGVNIQQDEIGQTPPFYVALIESDELLTSVVNDSIEGGSAPGSKRAIVDVISKRAGPPRVREDDATRRLRERLAVGADSKTGIVTISVTATAAPEATDLVAALLRAVDRFDSESRRTQASAQRRFVQRQMTEAGDSLRTAEDRAEAFLQRNHQYQDSPELIFQQERLARAVSLRQQVYTTLSSSFEQARIDEVRDTPAITIIDRPRAPVRPDARHLVMKSIVAALFGSLIGIVFVYATTFGFVSAAEIAAHPSNVTALSALGAVVGDIRHPWRLFRRLIAPRRRSD